MISAPTPGSCSRTTASSMPPPPPGSPIISCHHLVANIHSWSRSPAWPNGASRLRPSPVPNPSSETEKNWTRAGDVAAVPFRLVDLGSKPSGRRVQRPVHTLGDGEFEGGAVFPSSLQRADEVSHRPFEDRCSVRP